MSIVRKFGVILMGALLWSAVPRAVAKETATTKPSASSKEIKASDADAIKDMADLPATVVGTVDKAAWSGNGKVMRISFKDTDTSKFEAVVFAKNKDALDKKFKGNAAETLSGAKVKVKGTISSFAPKNNPDDKHPQIVINNVKQIELAEEK